MSLYTFASVNPALGWAAPTTTLDCSVVMWPLQRATDTEVGKRNGQARSFGNRKSEFKWDYTLGWAPQECLICASQIPRASW